MVEKCITDDVQPSIFVDAQTLASGTDIFWRPNVKAVQKAIL
jgi:hypothetical protein